MWYCVGEDVFGRFFVGWGDYFDCCVVVYCVIGWFDCVVDLFV